MLHHRKRALCKYHLNTLQNRSKHIPVAMKNQNTHFTNPFCWTALSTMSQYNVRGTVLCTAPKLGFGKGVVGVAKKDTSMVRFSPCPGA